MRRAFAAALALLLTGAPVVAAACALTCGVPASTAAAAADMPADCAAMHHGDADADPRPLAASDAARAARTSAAMPGCCAIAAASVDLPPASVERVAPVATSTLPVVVVVARVATTPVPANGAAPPGLARQRAHRTDILRL